MKKDRRMILTHELAKVLILLVLNRDIDKEELVFPEEAGEDARLFSMLDEGYINEAEDLLTKGLKPDDESQFGKALLFYDRLSEKPEMFLEAHGYSYQKLLEGMRKVVDYYRFGSLMEAFMEA